MLKIKHILFPTDFSDNAENALPFAIEIARNTGARLTLLHVIETPAYVPHDTQLMPETHSEKARELLQKSANHILSSDQNKNLEVDSILQNGNVVTSILNQTIEQDFDLVVMGTKGKSKMEHILYGSVASEILLDASVPVLSIPPNSNRAAFDPITFTTDYRAGDWQALKITMQWADTFGSDLHVLHVTKERNFDSEIKYRGFKNLVQEKAPDRNIQFDLVVQENFATGVADYLTEKPIGLLVLVRYDKGRLEKVLSTNHTKQLSYYTKVPLLVLKGEEGLSSAWG